MKIHITHQPHSVNPDHERRPGERKVRQKVEQELRKFFGDDLMLEHWTETLTAMWEEAIDLGCSPETAQEKLDESLRAVITYHRLDLPILQRRKMIQSVLDHMSTEIKTEVHHKEEDLQIPLSRDERRKLDRQKRNDDDPQRAARESVDNGYRQSNSMRHRTGKSKRTGPGVSQVF